MKIRIIVPLLLTFFVFTVVSNGQTVDSRLFNERHIKSVMKKALNWQLHHPKHKLYD